MNTVGNQRLGMAYKTDDDLYNTEYEIEHTANQGYTPNFSIRLGGRKVACRIGDVKMPLYSSAAKVCHIDPVLMGILFELFSWSWRGCYLASFG